jgi:L-fuculose-phosphate aldolase
METLEHFARITLVAKLLGRERPLPPEAVQKLFQLRERAGMMTPSPALCGVPDRSSSASSDEVLTLTRQQLIELIAETVEAVLRSLNLAR